MLEDTKRGHSVAVSQRRRYNIYTMVKRKVKKNKNSH
jgi:hypothetical protein